MDITETERLVLIMQDAIDSDAALLPNASPYMQAELALAALLTTHAIVPRELTEEQRKALAYELG